MSNVWNEMFWDAKPNDALITMEAFEQYLHSEIHSNKITNHNLNRKFIFFILQQLRNISDSFLLKYFILCNP